MNAKILRNWLGALAALLAGSLAAQAQPTAAPASPASASVASAPAGTAPTAAVAAGPAATAPDAKAAATDVLLLSSGREVAGRVLTITPIELTYVPVDTPAARPPARPDTVRLPVADVFLVRYANGTREVLGRPAPAPAAPDDATPPALRPLDPRQRQALGQRDARQHYRADGPFWGALGSTLYLTPLFGLAPAVAISTAPVQARNFDAPQPALLADATYRQGYQAQADRTKRRRTWAGYAFGTVAYALLFTALVTGVR